MEYITGSSGFLGSNLLKTLPSSVVPVSHYDIGAIRFTDAERVYFLSTYGNMATHSNEELIVHANIIDLYYVLATLDMKKIKNFLYISTSSVKLKHQTFYSRTKRMAEELLFAYMEKYNIPITIIRPFSITGVGEQKEHLIPRLIDSCIHGTPMPFVLGASHDFIDVSDVVSGITTLIDQNARGIYELGTGSSYTNEQVLEMVEKETGKKANIKIVKNLRSYDTDTWESNNFKARQYGWKPKKTLHDSIREMVHEEKSK